MPDRLLSALTRLCRETLSPRLTGVYLHGSLAMGCFRWAVSDVDLLLVAQAPVPAAAREALLEGLLRLAPHAPPKGMELSLVLLEDCARPRCPAPYQFHISPLYYSAAQEDPAGFCARMQGEDADLPAHFALTRQRGRALWGPPPRAVFAPVPRAAYLADGRLRSKAEGGLWAHKNLPEHLRQAADRAMAAYLAGGVLSGAEAAAFAEAVLPRIRREMDAALTSRS